MNASSLATVTFAINSFCLGSACAQGFLGNYRLASIFGVVGCACGMVTRMAMLRSFSNDMRALRGLFRDAEPEGREG